MCGIAGIVDLDGRAEIAPARLRAMTDAIAHRGPDGEGIWRAPGVGFGHRRLAIIDPEGGAQPMTAPDGRLAVTFNGMIYNFQTLRAELERDGARFLTDCDTEVLLHGWRAWGAGLAERLDGFFAAAIWDEDAQSLALLRDRWGKKPLFYRLSPRGEALFGSDLPAILAGMDGTPPVRRDALADYLAFGYVPEPKCILEGIAKLPPAHLLILKRGAWLGAQPRRYWRIRVHPGASVGSREEAAEALTPLLRAAVKKRLIADVPLGAFLSGGVDSAAILALASEARGGGLDACTMGFCDPAYDETALAAETARRFGARHHVETVPPEAMADLDALTQAYGEPFADASALPTLQLCRLAARHVKVALSGDGGDELFAGYRRYPHHAMEERIKAALPGALRGGVLGPLARAWPAGADLPRWLRAQSTLEALSTDAMGGLFRATAILQEPARDALMGLAPGEYSSVDQLRAAAAEADTDDPLARAQYVDLVTWLPGRMLVKVDRAAMACGVEVRNPLLDVAVAEWAATLPSALKLRGGAGKQALKAAMRPLVPAPILDGAKRGFVAPIGDWMRDRYAPRMARLARHSRLAESGLIAPEAAAAQWEAHAAGRADNSRALWALLALDGFLARLDAGAAARQAA